MTPATRELSYDPDAYRVVVEVDGCEHCGSGRQWTVVDSDDCGIGISFDREDDAQEVADHRNEAYNVGESHGLATAPAAFQDDLAAILRAAVLSDAARPYSPHEVVQRDLLPRLAALRAAPAPRVGSPSSKEIRRTEYTPGGHPVSVVYDAPKVTMHPQDEVGAPTPAPPSPAEAVPAADALVARQWEPSPNMIAASTQLLSPTDRHIDVRSLLIAAHRARPPETEGPL